MQVLQKNNILFYFLSLGEGGAQRQTINLISEFSKMNNNIFILTRNSNNDFINSLADNVNITTIYANSRKRNKIFSFIYELVFLIKYIVKKRIQIVYARGYPFYIKSSIVKYLIPRIKIIAVEANSVSQNIKSKYYFTQKIKYKACQLSLSNCDVIYCLTKDNRLDLVKTLSLPQSKVDIFPVVFNLNFFKSLNNSKKPEILKNNKFNSIIIGRYVRQKHHKLAIKSFSPLDDSYHLHLFGEGILKSYYNKLIISEKTKRKISIHSFKKNIYEIIYHSDLILFTSIYEGFGNVLLESLLIGKPIISTKFIGIDDFLLNKLEEMNLLLIDFQPETLTKKIVEVRENYSVFQKMILSHRTEISEKYSLDKYFKKLENDIKKLEKH